MPLIAVLTALFTNQFELRKQMWFPFTISFAIAKIWLTNHHLSSFHNPLSNSMRSHAIVKFALLLQCNCNYNYNVVTTCITAANKSPDHHLEFIWTSRSDSDQSQLRVRLLRDRIRLSKCRKPIQKLLQKLVQKFVVHKLTCLSFLESQKSLLGQCPVNSVNIKTCKWQ